LDCHWRLLELLVRARCSDGIGGFRDYAIQHKLELDGGQSTSGMQCELQGTAEFNRNCNPNHNIGYRNWSQPVDHLQLLGRSDGLGRYLGGEFGHQRDDFG
jgi:hypothetical protein